MKSKEFDTFVLIEGEQDLKQFVNNIKISLLKNFKDKNVVINLLDFKDFTIEKLLLLLHISNLHRSNSKSFVIVNNTINSDDIPDEIVVVPTLQEAEDIIEMEEIERELGF